MTDSGVFRLASPASSAVRADSKLQLAAAIRKHKEAIALSWLQLASAQEGIAEVDLGRQLRSLLTGLVEVFELDDWTLTQTIIDSLAERRARMQGSSDHGFQRALISGRHAIRPYISNSIRDRELLLETLHECVFRYYESYEGERIATENDRLHTRIIRSLVMALEARDPYTKGHSLSVALLCQKLAQEMDGVDPHHAYLGGLLHDVGKVGIPDRILAKEAPLSDEEWVIMRAHPVMGANILSPIKLYPSVVDGVLAHHENWDGTGYPMGLSGNEIPILGRMIRVADTFDAMTSTRAFRSSRSISVSIGELQDMSTISYDADIVKVLASVVDEPETIRELSLASLQIDLARGY